MLEIGWTVDFHQTCLLKWMEGKAAKPRDVERVHLYSRFLHNPFDVNTLGISSVQSFNVILVFV